MEEYGRCLCPEVDVVRLMMMFRNSIVNLGKFVILAIVCWIERYLVKIRGHTIYLLLIIGSWGDVLNVS